MGLGAAVAKTIAIAWITAGFVGTAARGQHPSERTHTGTATQNDTALFRSAVMDSYDGQHETARRDFAEYEALHPDDLLARLRNLYDHQFDTRPDVPSNAYGAVMKEADDAIKIYEHVGCAGTDIRGLTGGTVDCAYIGAALYSFREVWRFEHAHFYRLPFVFGKIKDDDRKFFACTRVSHAVQTQFLLGVHEYEMSRVAAVPFTASKLKGAHIPFDRDDALRKMTSALVDTGPFADDVWFYLYHLERNHEKEAWAKELVEAHPLQSMRQRLEAKYPDNRVLWDGSDLYASY